MGDIKITPIHVISRYLKEHTKYDITTTRIMVGPDYIALVWLSEYVAVTITLDESNAFISSDNPGLSIEVTIPLSDPTLMSKIITLLDDLACKLSDHKP